MRQFQCSEGPGLYRLKVSLNEDIVNLEMGRDAKANFSTVTTGLKYELTRLRDNKVIAKGDISAPNYKVLTESYYLRQRWIILQETTTYVICVIP